MTIYSNMKTFNIGEFTVRKLDTHNWVIEKDVDVVAKDTGEVRQEPKIQGYYNSIDGVFMALITQGVEESTSLADFKKWRDEVLKGHKLIKDYDNKQK